MNNKNIGTKEIENLIVANYERMVAFEQAAFNSSSSDLKIYFEEKAAESETNIRELSDLVKRISGNNFNLDNAEQFNLLGTNHLFIGQKNINTLLKNIQYLEKSVIRWYKMVMKNLKGLSRQTNITLNKHYEELQASQLYVQNC